MNISDSFIFCANIILVSVFLILITPRIIKVNGIGGDDGQRVGNVFSLMTCVYRSDRTGERGRCLAGHVAMTAAKTRQTRRRGPCRGGDAFASDAIYFRRSIGHRYPGAVSPKEQLLTLPGCNSATTVSRTSQSKIVFPTRSPFTLITCYER